MLRGDGRAVLLAAVVVCAASALLPSAAYGALYWTTAGGLGRANTDGSETDRRFLPEDQAGVPADFAACEGVAVDGQYLYWSEPAHRSIARANLDGSGVEYDFISGLNGNPCGLALDATAIYWTEERGGTIGRANLDGSAVDQSFITGEAEPCGIAIGGGYLYWTAGYDVDRAPLSSRIPQQIYEGGESSHLCGVALDGSHVYWGGFGQSIGRVQLDGTKPEPSYIDELERPCGIALQGSRIYWTENTSTGTLQGTDLEGSHVAQTIVKEAGYFPCGLAVDSARLAPPFPPASVLPHQLAFLDVRHGAYSPVVFITIHFPQAGAFTVRTGPALRWRVVSHGRSAFALNGPEARVLELRPAARSQPAQALRRRLSRRGKAPASVSVHFSAADGTASTKKKRFFLVEPPSRPPTGQ